MRINDTIALLTSTTGHSALNGPFVNAPSLPNPVVDGLDQFAAEHLHGETRFASLPLSCEGFGLSWTRSGRLVPTESGRRACSPSCSSKGGRTRSQAQARRLRDGQSMLDAVREQAKTLQPALGAGDREKLDEYFTSVRELEQRLAQAEAWSKKPKPKVDAKPPQNVTNSTDLIGKTRLWFDLIHLALQTDSTRLVTLQLLGTSGVPPIPGVSARRITTCRTTARTRPRSPSSRCSKSRR